MSLVEIKNFTALTINQFWSASKKYKKRMKNLLECQEMIPAEQKIY